MVVDASAMWMMDNEEEEGEEGLKYRFRGGVVDRWYGVLVRSTLQVRGIARGAVGFRGGEPRGF
jgi:hypothetical protein